MANKPSIPKGTRDFSPQEMLRRKYIFNTIEKVFQKYGYLPLETPAMENLETLTGKYGEEGDRLIFKILNSGNAWDGVSDNVKNAIKAGDAVPSGRLAAELSEKALRYDLTVPFARYVVQHQNEITFPFKRYQIQPVWRADRPQKGRYREFYQCDADVIGSRSLVNEVELVLLMLDVFDALGLAVEIRVNERKILHGITQYFGVEDRAMEFITILDKLDKVNFEGLPEEYRKAGFSEFVVQELVPFLKQVQQPTEEIVWGKPTALNKKFAEKGLAYGSVGDLNVVAIIDGVKRARPDLTESQVVHDITLARGLNYYTGAIFEVKALEGSLRSSICGGGRYDDLTGIFGLKNMSGVGISFGADRIYDVLLELNKFSSHVGGSSDLLFVIPLDEDGPIRNSVTNWCIGLSMKLRRLGFSVELYPDPSKLAQQFTYAEKKGIPYVAIVGESEMKEGKVTLKRMGANEKGDLMTIEELINKLKG